jgi:hypothetical protein
VLQKKLKNEELPKKKEGLKKKKEDKKSLSAYQNKHLL